MNQFEGFEGRSGACSVCEAMLPEAVDGMLSETEQNAFDRHVAGCVECARELAEARRGAAWLSMLKSQAPEPPAGLLAKILAETTGAAQHHVVPAAAPAVFIPVRPVVVPAVVELQKGFADHRPALRKFWDGFPRDQQRADYVSTPSRDDGGHGIFLDRADVESHRSSAARSASFELYAVCDQADSGRHGCFRHTEV